MNIPIPDIVPIDRQPAESIEEVAGIYFRSVLLVKKGTVIPQHIHSYDHATLVAAGKVRLWMNGMWKGDFCAGRAIEIRANQNHLFQSLETNTRLVCIHDTNSSSLIKEMERKVE